jgi:hypothetical protein
VIGHKEEEMTKCPRILYNVELHNLYFSSDIWEDKRFPQFSHININALPVKLRGQISQGQTVHCL